MIKQQINSAASALFTGILLFYTQSSFGDSVHLIMGNPEPQISSPGTDTQIMADAVFDAEGVSQEQITLYPDAEIQYSWFWEFNPGGKVTNVDADYFQQHEAITNPSPWLSVSTTNATGSFPLAGISSMNVTVWARVVVPSTGFISQPVKGTAAASTVSVGIGSITWTHSGGFIPGVWGNADCLPSAIGWVWEFTALPSPGEWLGQRVNLCGRNRPVQLM